MVVLHHLYTFLSQRLLHLDSVEELACKPKQGILGPVLEPVNRTTINQRGEHPDPCPEVITNGAECQYNMKILLTLLDKERIHLRRCSFFEFSLSLHHWPNHFYQFSLFVGWEQIRHFISVEQVVDVLYKGLVLDLAVSEEEDGWLVLTS